MMDAIGLSNLSVEPTALRQLTTEQKDRLTDILDEYLSALETGVPPDAEKLLRDHPDLAGPLTMYLNRLEDLHGMAAGFSDPSRRSATQAVPPEDDEKRLGDFVLLREVGRGGMGVVFEARQLSLGRRVAVKVLPFAAVLDSKQIARFKNEAQAAAQLLHPNIVPVFAVGVERGVHYYAMQFIDGQPLDRTIAELRRKWRVADTESSAGDEPSVGDVKTPAADESPAELAVPSTCHSFLTEKSRNRQQYFRTVVRLGIQAAEALHAAHEYGVVHRDIKPSNLMLDGDGKLWVTDFGLARCQSNMTLTKTGDVVGTLRYMSPEQALGQTARVDQRTDVYSLGATLYELLTLRPAFPGKDGLTLTRQIEQQEPVRLRQWQPDIPADLETVVLKTLAKRREDRYATAQQFADDLSRVLAGKPALAKPPTMPDRVHKWARRHRRLVGAIAGICFLVVTGLAGSSFFVAREKTRAEKNYAAAEANYRQARRAVDQFGARLAERLADIPGAEQVRRDLLKDTLEYYRSFVEQAGTEPKLRADLAMTYTKIGTIAGEIGSTADATAAYRDAETILSELAAARPGDAEHRRHLALCRNNLGLLLRRSGSIDEARRVYRAAIGLQEKLVANFPDVPQHRADLALSHTNLGLLQSETGERRQAEQSFSEAIRLQQELLNASPDAPELLRNLAASYNNLSALYANEQSARAAELYDQALTLQQRAAAARPDVLEYRSDLALTYSNLGAAQSRAGQFSQAAASFDRAIESQHELVQLVPARASYRRDLAVSYNNLGMAQVELRQTASAEQSFHQALELQESLVAQHPGDVGLHSSLGGIYNNLGIVLEELQRIPQAAEAYRRAIECQKVAYAQAAGVERYRTFLSKHCYNYGRILRRLGSADQAAQVALERKKLWPDDPQRLLTVAEELALASQIPGDHRGPGMTAEQCAESAIETLREAIAAGLEVPADLGRNEAFTTLRNRPDFVELVKR
jgi:hypothetical protein